MNLLELYHQVSEDASPGYSAWKRKNVTLRGMKEFGVNNGVWGSFGVGLYTVPLSNKAMAKQYGDVYFVVGAIPEKPKIVQSLNDAEILRQTLVIDFCKKHGRDREHDITYFDAHTTIEDEMIARGFDGLIIKGREMVNYKPDMGNVKYFKDEHQLQRYYESLQP